MRRRNQAAPRLNADQPDLHFGPYTYTRGIDPSKRTSGRTIDGLGRMNPARWRCGMAINCIICRAVEHSARFCDLRSWRLIDAVVDPQGRPR